MLFAKKIKYEIEKRTQKYKLFISNVNGLLYTVYIYIFMKIIIIIPLLPI